MVVAREESRKLRERGNNEILRCTARLSLTLGIREPGPLGSDAVAEVERLARLKGGLMSGSPIEAANVATASLARCRGCLSVVLQRGNAAMVLAALGRPQPAPIDADLRERDSPGSAGLS